MTGRNIALATVLAFLAVGFAGAQQVASVERASRPTLGTKILVNLADRRQFSMELVGVGDYVVAIGNRGGGRNFLVVQ